ncbi:hypothetical protein H0266_18175 [Halobacillus locisalis]|uniref:Uncharacterized protein n=2 Tax=Halobacillus locisalis TaxID=220753 RepID=A0A838CY86_9BACI|nr:hypothetical protein [Halobacillus locisalis]
MEQQPMEQQPMEQQPMEKSTAAPNKYKSKPKSSKKKDNRTYEVDFDPSELSSFEEFESSAERIEGGTNGSPDFPSMDESELFSIEEMKAQEDSKTSNE